MCVGVETGQSRTDSVSKVESSLGYVHFCQNNTFKVTNLINHIHLLKRFGEVNKGRDANCGILDTEITCLPNHE